MRAHHEHPADAGHPLFLEALKETEIHLDTLGKLLQLGSLLTIHANDNKLPVIMPEEERRVREQVVNTIHAVERAKTRALHLHSTHNPKQTYTILVHCAHHLDELLYSGNLRRLYNLDRIPGHPRTTREIHTHTTHPQDPTFAEHVLRGLSQTAQSIHERIQES